MLKHCYHKHDDYTIIVYAGTNLRAQSFTPDVTFTCTGLTVFLSKLGAPTGTLTYSLYLANGSGNPTGAALATATPSYADLDAAYPGQPLRGAFTPGVVLTSGTQYVFTLNLSAGNATNALRITYKMVGDYSGGNDKLSINSGASWSDTTADLLFDLWDANTAGITRYYALSQAAGVSRFQIIYRDASYSTVEESTTVTGATACILLKSANYLYTVCGQTGSAIYVTRFDVNGVKDTSWATSGMLTIAGGGALHASVSQDDWLFVSMAAGTWGRLYMYDGTGTQVWNNEPGVHYYYFMGTAMAATADICVYCIETGGGWVNGYRYKRSDNSELLNFMIGAQVPKQVAIRESNTHMFALLGNGNCVLREYQESADTYLWTTTVSPACGTGNCLVHLPDTDLVFVGSVGLNSVSLVKFNSATGAQSATFDTGGAVKRIEIDRNGELLVCGVTGSDGVGTTTLRQMSTDLSVEWRFDTNFTNTLFGVVVPFNEPPEIITQSGTTNVTEGDAVHLFVTAIGFPDSTYQWYKNGDLLPGETADTYNIAVSIREDSGIYTCIASNIVGTDTSDYIYVGVFVPSGTSNTELLAQLIRQKRVRICEMYDITLRNGVLLNYTNHNEDILWGANSVLYRSAVISRGSIEANINLTVDKLTVSMGNVADPITSELYFQLKSGLFRDAQVVLKRVCWNQDYGIGMEEVLFSGWIGISYDENILTLDCTSVLDCLNHVIPRFVFQPSCNHRLYDDFCDVPRIWVDSICTTDSTSLVEVLDSVFILPPSDPTAYLRGEIEILTGANALERRMIYYTIDGQFIVSSPFYYIMKTGDTFRYCMGCDLRPETCDVRFGNIDNFLGFIYIPNIEDLIY